MDASPRSRALDLFAGQGADTARQRKVGEELASLMGEIAACREAISRGENFAMELEGRLHREWQPWEDQIRKVRVDSLRILAAHVRQGWLKRRSAEMLTRVLNEFARELE